MIPPNSDHVEIRQFLVLGNTSAVTNAEKAILWSETIPLVASILYIVAIFSLGIIHAGNQTKIMKNRALISQSNYLDLFNDQLFKFRRTRRLDKDFIAQTIWNIYAVKIIFSQ